MEGLNYSLFSLTRKCGLALGGSVSVFLLAGAAYTPNLALQDTRVLLAIHQSLTLLPAIAFFAAFLTMFFYPLSDRRFLEIVRETRICREAGESKIRAHGNRKTTR